MASSAISSNASSQVGSAIQSAAGNTQIDEQTFLQLLVTQLQNQDPTQPQDPTQFLSQLAQFSTLEGINNVSQSQTDLQGAALLGQTVSGVATINNVQTPVEGTVTSVNWTSTGVNVNVTNSSNQTTTLPLTSVQLIGNQTSGTQTSGSQTSGSGN